MDCLDAVPTYYSAVRMNGKTGRKRGGIRVSPELERINGDELNGDSLEVKPSTKLKREERDSSTESSDSTNSSSSSSSSSSGTATTAARPSSLWEVDELGEHLQVTCAENEAKFYKNRFARGSIGRCVLFRGRWITPNEFQAISGRQSSKDWKRSIRLNGRCLKEYINDGLFKEHQKNCICSVCLGVDTDQLRQEGVMALAAKRRRLSQADAGSSTSLQNIEGVSAGGLATPPATNNSETTNETSDKKLPGSGVKRKRKAGRTAKTQRVWSPSGEVAPDMSSNEDDHKPSQPLEDTEDPTDTKPVIDASDFLPRRSRRTAHRKLGGHRTELGTFSHKPSDWDSDEVAEFLKLQGFADYADSFLKGEINGQSMFLLREHHLLEQFNMKLGPALRLLDTISRLRHPPMQ